MITSEKIDPRNNNRLGCAVASKQARTTRTNTRRAARSNKSISKFAIRISQSVSI